MPHFSSTVLRTAGARVAIESGDRRMAAALRAATGGTWSESREEAGAVDVRLSLEPDRRSFELREPVPVTRGVWTNRDGQVLVKSAGGSGFSQLWSVDGQEVHVRSRWAPSTTEAIAAAALRTRFDALRAQVLLHYPAMWWAAMHGMAPLHVSVVEIGGVAVLLAGPGGVGKSSLVARELARGASAACDNLAVSDGVTAFGLGEPLRLPPDAGDTADALELVKGQRTTHGRRQQQWRGRVPALQPDLIAVIRRGDQPLPVVRRVDAGTAARTLVAGTFAAGELRRFWQLAAMIALGTGAGPALPPVEQVATTLAGRLPCVEITLGRRPGAGLTELLAGELTSLRAGASR